MMNGRVETRGRPYTLTTHTPPIVLMMGTALTSMSSLSMPMLAQEAIVPGIQMKSTCPRVSYMTLS